MQGRPRRDLGAIGVARCAAANASGMAVPSAGGCCRWCLRARACASVIDTYTCCRRHCVRPRPIDRLGHRRSGTQQVVQVATPGSVSSPALESETVCRTSPHSIIAAVTSSGQAAVLVAATKGRHRRRTRAWGRFTTRTRGSDDPHRGCRGGGAPVTEHAVPQPGRWRDPPACRGWRPPDSGRSAVDKRTAGVYSQDDSRDSVT